MSVTFTIESIATGRATAACVETDAPIGAGTFASYEDALRAGLDHAVRCADCADYPSLIVSTEVDVESDQDVNLSNANAAMILGVLGVEVIDGDMCGGMPGDEFLGYTLAALAMPRDEAAVPAQERPRAFDEDGSPVGWRWIDCGLREGYVPETLARLADLATEAARLGRDVVWS